MMTFLAPFAVWADAFSVVVKTPVDSTTYSAPADPQLMLAGSRSPKTWILAPLTYKNSPSCFTSPWNLPWVEWYLRWRRCLFQTLQSLPDSFVRIPM